MAILEKTNGHAALFALYDLLALAPTTAASFSLACLTHTQPSPLTTHVIALPLTLPRLPFNLKHTLVRAALGNGAVFEINYAGALGGGSEGPTDIAGGEGSGAGAKRNWWAAAREVTRVTKGKGVLVSGGVFNEADLRAPRDVANLCVLLHFTHVFLLGISSEHGDRISMLGVAQDVAHAASTKVPQSLILRARESHGWSVAVTVYIVSWRMFPETRRTYRAVFSEPKVVTTIASELEPTDVPMMEIISGQDDVHEKYFPAISTDTPHGQKRALDEGGQEALSLGAPKGAHATGSSGRKKKKNKSSTS